MKRMIKEMVDDLLPILEIPYEVEVSSASIYYNGIRLTMIDGNKKVSHIISGTDLQQMSLGNLELEVSVILTNMKIKMY